jgi:VWFA-related protein
VPGAVTVVLLDVLNPPPEDEPYARQQLVKFLGTLQPQDHVAIYVLDSGLYVLHDFTQDMRGLIAAMDAYKARHSGKPGSYDEPPTISKGAIASVPEGQTGGRVAAASQAQQAARLLQDFIDSTNQKRQSMLAINHVDATTSALEAIAHHLADVPGRKNLVWISESFPLAVGMQPPSRKDSELHARDFQFQLERTARVLNQANVAVYPVHARGLAPPVNFDAAAPARGGSAEDPERAGEDYRLGFASMDLLAERTGGRAYHNSNDLTAAVRSALADGEASYNLAFYPARQTWDGKYHPLKVLVNRPGAQLTYRKGYFATAEAGAQPRAQWAAAVDSPIDATNLSISAKVSLSSRGGVNTADVSLTLDVAEIVFSEPTSRQNCVLDFLFVQRDDTGKQLAGEEKTASIDVPQAKYQSYLNSELVVTHNLAVIPGASQLRIVVRDRRSGAIGSLTIPLQFESAGGRKH